MQYTIQILYRCTKELVPYIIYFYSIFTLPSIKSNHIKNLLIPLFLGFIIFLFPILLIRNNKKKKKILILNLCYNTYRIQWMATRDRTFFHLSRNSLHPFLHQSSSPSSFKSSTHDPPKASKSLILEFIFIRNGIIGTARRKDE